MCVMSVVLCGPCNILFCCVLFSLGSCLHLIVLHRYLETVASHYCKS